MTPVSEPIPGDYDPWWDVTTVWENGQTQKATIRRSEIADYLFNLPARYLVAFSAGLPPESEPMEAERGAPPK